MTAVAPRQPHAAAPESTSGPSEGPDRPTVVLVDWNVTPASPIGSSILEILRGSFERYRFVVVASYFENPRPGEIEHVRVRLPPVPTFVKELCWPGLVGLAFRRGRLRALKASAVIRATQGQLPGATIVSAHFCHRAYLREYFAGSGTRGLRRISRFLVHRYSAYLEKKAFRQAQVVAVPSSGLGREIGRIYPEIRDKIVCIPNPVDTARFAPEPGFDRAEARRELNFGPGDVVFAFVALGDFARKGLEVGIRALAQVGASDARILVVGGTKGEIQLFREIAREAGVEESVRFVGFQKDVRPYLWLSDAFLFPTIYEAASKAVLQAAAAGLPIIAPSIHGIEDVVVDGVNGWFAERAPETFAAAMGAALSARATLPEMGLRAQEAVQPFDVELYVERWGELFSRLIRDGATSATPARLG